MKVKLVSNRRRKWKVWRHHTSNQKIRLYTDKNTKEQNFSIGQISKDYVLESTKEIFFHVGNYPLKITFAFFQWKSQIATTVEINDLYSKITIRLYNSVCTLIVMTINVNKCSCTINKQKCQLYWITEEQALLRLLVSWWLQTIQGHDWK